MAINNVSLHMDMKETLEIQRLRLVFYPFLLVLGDVPCIVSSGEGGFIPVRFLTGSTIHMSGHSKL